MSYPTLEELDMNMGDLVRRREKENDEFWKGECRIRGQDPEGEFTIIHIFDRSEIIGIRLRNMGQFHWDAFRFEKVDNDLGELGDWI
jgi:hypothetical protein